MEFMLRARIFFANLDFSILTALTIVLTITLSVWKYLTRSKYKLPPGPIGLPFLGYFPFLSKNKAHLQLFKLREKYGPVVSMYLGSRLVVVLLDFPTVKEAFSKDSFLGRPPVSAFTLVKEGVSFNDSSGNLWKSNRRFTMQVLRDLGFGKTHMETHIQNEISELLTHLSAANGQALETRKPLTSSVSNNITAFIFGRRLDYNDPQRSFLDHVVLLIMDFFKQTSVHAYFPWVMKIFVFFKLLDYDKAKDTLLQFYSFVDDEVAAHRRTMVEGQNRDYIDGYIQEIDKRNKDNGSAEADGFSVRYMKGNIRSIFGAGSEASRTTLEWCLMTIAAFPDYQKKVQREIDDTIGRDGMPALADQTRTPLTCSAILEVMRWRGIVPLGIVRLVTEDDKLRGYDIPKGTLAMAHLWGVHHDPNLWDDPDTYKPERFLTDGGTKVSKPEFYIPFSYGRRACPGESLANNELYLYFSTILQKFDVLPPEGKKNLFEEELAITLQLLDTRLRFIRRKN